MRLTTLSVGLLAILTPLTAAWSKEDREIFRLRDELAAAEGPEVNFYQYLGIPQSASQDDINKAYRKKSRSFHPDKVKQQLAAERAAAAKKAKKAAGGKPGVNVAKPPSQAEIKAAVKKASDAQARLSIITNVLRGAGRERYDHFLANGFPVWKGTGYYYNRYRPGFGTVLVGLFIFGGGAAHYLALYMGWKRQREFVERYIKFARHAAWGENLGINVPGVDGSTASLPPAAAALTPEEEEGRVMPTNRRMRRMQEKETKREAAKDAAANLGRRGRKNAPASASGSGTATPTPAPVAASGPGPQGAKKRVVAENGKILVVDSLGDVYLEQQDEEGKIQEFLLDADEIPPPTISDTAVVRLPLFLYRQTVGRALGQHKAAGSDDEYDSDAEEVGDVDDEEDSEPGKATPSTDSNEDFELLEKSTDSLGQARSSGVAGGRAKGKQRKAGKRK